MDPGRRRQSSPYGLVNEARFARSMNVPVMYEICGFAHEPKHVCVGSGGQR